MADEVYPRAVSAPRAWAKAGEVASVALEHRPVGAALGGPEGGPHADDARPSQVRPGPGGDHPPDQPAEARHAEVGEGLGGRLEAARERALAASEIARLSQLPSDLVVAAIAAGIAILRTRGIGPLPIVLALAEAVDGHDR